MTPPSIQYNTIKYNTTQHTIWSRVSTSRQGFVGKSLSIVEIKEKEDKLRSFIRVISCSSMFVNIMFYTSMGRFLELPLFQVSLSSHSISWVCSCRPFVNLLTSSAGLVGCRNFFCRRRNFDTQKRAAENVNKLTKGLQEQTQITARDDGETCK